MNHLEEEVGRITHYFSKIGVAVLKLSGSIRVGDTIRIRGHSTDFKQKVSSMQVEHKNIPEAKSGDEVGLKVESQVREGDLVYLVKE
ncbi:MAG: EF-Tu/IF-2/RF-3 family GTPase [Candidatus Woesearchaeota archaeon]